MHNFLGVISDLLECGFHLLCGQLLRICNLREGIDDQFCESINMRSASLPTSPTQKIPFGPIRIS